MKSFLNGSTPISALFSSNKEAFSLSSPFSSDPSGNTTTDPSGNTSGSGIFGNMFSGSTDPSGNTTTDPSGNTSGGVFGSMGSMFSGSTDASGNSTVDASGNSTVDASGNPVNTNPSISTYADFFKSLFFLFIKICIVGYLGASFLCLVRMSRQDLTNYLPSDINRYPYCSPDGTQEFGVVGDNIYSYGFPYNLYCDSNDDEKCSKTCRVIKNELQDPDAFIEYTPFAFWLSLSMKNTYATFRAFIKMVCIKMGNLLGQNQYDSYGILENVVMLLGVLLVYMLVLYGGFIGFFMTYAFQFYNSGFLMSGFAWTLGLFLISWIPPFFNFFGFILQMLITFLWIPFTQNTKHEAPKENTKVVFEIFKSKKNLLMVLFSIGMVMNAFDYLTDYEPYYVLVAVSMFILNMYVFNSSKATPPN
jgi:hypothetical protein